jgi:hypothetical protein
MTEEQPLACSLNGGDLERRLAAISDLGRDSLLGRSVEEGRHRLRFRSDEGTRRRLDEVVAAEAECCSFLALEVSEADGDLLLSIAAPAEAQEMADGLAACFEALAGQTAPGEDRNSGGHLPRWGSQRGTARL